MPDQTLWGFFSYSRHDSDFVLKLAKDLRAAGASVWLDQLDITPGQHWDSAIEKALGNCPRMLVILSPDSVESTNVMDEVSFALEENKVVIPVLYRDCKTPFRLRRLQYVDARVDYQKGLSQLLAMLGIPVPAGSLVSPPPPATLEEHMPASEAAADTPAKEKTHQERLIPENAETVRRALEKSAAEAREHEQPAQTKAELERQAPARAQQERPDRNKREAMGSSRTKYFIAAAAAVVVILGVWAGLPKPPPSSTTKNNPQADVANPEYSRENPRSPERSPEKQPEPDTIHTIQWVQEFLDAGEGPPVSRIRPFYDDVVSPYFGQQSAAWDEIEKDKQAYFRRFPTIHYTLLGRPEFSTPEGGVPGGGKVLEFDLQYSNLRKDGQTLEGTSHLTMNLRAVDGRWKITGIRERTVTR